MVGTKYCSNCGNQLDERAEICPNCGVRQATIRYHETVYQLKNPGVAAVLSAVFVGLGQIYNGEIAKGLMFMLAYFVSIILIFLVIGLITTPLLWIYGIYDAYDSAKRINTGEKVV